MEAPARRNCSSPDTIAAVIATLAEQPAAVPKAVAKRRIGQAAFALKVGFLASTSGEVLALLEAVVTSFGTGCKPSCYERCLYSPSVIKERC